MTLEQMLKWKHGNIDEYERILKEQEKLRKKLYKVCSDIDYENDVLELFDAQSDEDKDRWNTHYDKLTDLRAIKEKLLIKFKENNERLEREFY